MARVQMDNAEAFEAAVSDSFVPLRVSRATEPSLRGSVEQRSAGAAAISLVRTGPVSVHRSAELINDSPRSLVLLTMQLHGSSTVSQGGATARLRPGQGAIYLSDRPYDLVTQVRSGVVVFHTPLHLLNLSDTDWVPGAPRVLDAATSWDYRMLRNLSRSYLRAMPLIDDEGQMELIATGLVASIMARASRGRSGPLDHYTLFALLTEEIDARLGDPSLSVASLARTNGVSDRTVYRCFEVMGHSPAAVFRARRLDRAASLLTSTGMSVAQIASEVGMLDPSTLSKSLRRDRGTSARGIRAASIPVGHPRAG
ncbi:helix-turn-helix domain-containing protein [Cryobacterium sp. SO1]|uniref:helix-turn-helix domain-containing protein n=1 Tax=Cryobacterium sp. SO1 TaxID=1897061 RepID=UPI0010232571|nr:helix-turn-helix domain-containing protein [Cryobacterium sp. SO1]RZI35247.1 hypothetical protein BJQ95_02313 [Cryobacterium sp. SO1]